MLEFEKSLNISLIPNIVFYTESVLDDKDLESKGGDLGGSNFFTTLFKLLNLNMKSIQKVLNGDAPSRKSKERNIEKECKKISQRFNALYCLSKDYYGFNLSLDENKLVFWMEKNGELIRLSQQSTGFKKFFNLFFNFLYDDKIKRGDIVLIDEAETHLSIPAQKELCKFLRDYGRESGITFIASTHSPYMVCAMHLDCVRIVKALESSDDLGVGSLFINDFSMLGYGEIDTLKDLRNALGANIEIGSWLIFVEGIMDYNILNAYAQIFFKDSKDSKKLIFLPISGLGGADTESRDENQKELSFSDEQREKAQNLINFARRINVSNPVLLVDSDKSGKAMKRGVSEDSSIKALFVIELEDVFMENGKRKKNFGNFGLTGIECLFSEDDRKKFHLESCKEEKQASIVSSVFKNTEDLELKLSGESKKNFNELFSYITSFLSTHSNFSKL